MNWRLLRPLFAGVCLGTPLGALAYLSLSLASLKLFAAAVVGVMTLIATGFLARHPFFETDTLPRRGAIGVLCGILNAALAMPGPPVAAYVTAIKSNPRVVRSTTLVTFLLSYPIALGFQAMFVGVSDTLAPTVLALFVPTVAGTFCGFILTDKLAARHLKWLTVMFLMISTVMLVY